MGKAKAPILDLALFEPERPTINVRTSPEDTGTLYELRIQDELSIEDLARIVELGPKAEALQQEEDFGSKEFALAEEYMDAILKIAFVADYDERLRPKLGLIDKARILAVFTEACLDLEELTTKVAEVQASRARTIEKTGGQR